jgi:hypothetical protein
VPVRRYRVKYSLFAEGRYAIKTREFGSLRSAGEFVRDFPEDHEFVEIRALDINPLDPQEKGAFAFFTDGKVQLE